MECELSFTHSSLSLFSAPFRHPDEDGKMTVTRRVGLVAHAVDGCFAGSNKTAGFLLLRNPTALLSDYLPCLRIIAHGELFRKETNNRRRFVVVSRDARQEVASDLMVGLMCTNKL